MTTLVTGGAGYIGSHVVRALVDRGDRVVVLDSLRSGRRSAVPAGIPFRQGDVRDRATVDDLLSSHDVDSVVHLAAAKSVAASMTDPGATFANNVTGTLTLLEAMAAAQVDRLVFSSTCAVYGMPERLPVDERAPIRPENPYGESKAMAERLIEWFGRVHGLRAVMLRYFNAAGAHPEGDLGEDWGDAENLIPVVLRAAASGGAVSVFGTDYETPDGTAIRDYVHVVDLAEAHCAALDYLAADGPPLTVNLGTGTGWSVLDVVEVARSVVGHPIVARHEPRRPGDPAEVWADPRRAAEALGWRSRLDLRDMISSAWRWHTSDGRAPSSPSGSPDRSGHRPRAAAPGRT